MSKQYIKMNDNDNHLSLGNLFRIVKELSKNKTSALQSELFCILFNVDNISETTVNNYCVGCRGIGNDYKQLFLNLDKKYLNDKKVFCDSIIGLLSVIDGVIYVNISDKINFINNNESARNLVSKLYNLSKNDNSIDESFHQTLRGFINNNDIYSALVECIKFIVLVKKQPINEEGLKKQVFEDVLNDTSISSESLQEYLSLKLREGINYDYQLKRMALLGNAYACFELGSNEYYGYYKGYPRYDEAFKYLNIAAHLNHAAANYMIATMYIKGMLGSMSNEDLDFGYEYLKKAYELGNIAACNVIGNMYKEGIYPLEKNEDLARKFYEKACAENYVYAFNNIGNIYEKEENFEKAFEFYKKSADMGESWACNKVGEYYRLGIVEKNMKLAFEYYNKALESNCYTLRYYAYYNLAKYFYLNGCTDIVLVKDVEKAKEYLQIASDKEVISATILLFYIFVQEYVESRDSLIYDKVLELKKKIEISVCDKKVIDEINDKLRDIKKLGTIDLDILN